MNKSHLTGIFRFNQAQVQEIVSRYQQGESSPSIAESFKCSMSRVLFCLHKHGVKMRDSTGYIPTQEEIAERAAQVRKGGGAKVEESRRVIPTTDPVTVSTCGSNHHRNGIESI